MLFGGAVPHNGFMVQWSGSYVLVVNDNGPAYFDYFGVRPTTGFYVRGDTTTFITPPGYKPMGPVSVFQTCVNSPPPGYVAARAW
jgi:hypothetical protein